MPELTIAERVAAGAEWLDANYPGWADRVDIVLLDIRDCEDCVLGQLAGNYWHAPLFSDIAATADDVPDGAPWHADPTAEDRAMRRSMPLGFCGDTFDAESALTHEWMQLIGARRESVNHA